MKKRKAVSLILLFAVLLVLIVIYIILKIHNQRTEEESEEIKSEEIFAIESGDIKSLSFIIEDQEVIFHRTEDGWNMESDESFPVNDDQMSVLTDALSSITANRTLKNVDNLSEYGLDDPVDIIRITDQNDETTVITIGDTNESVGDCYVYLNHDKTTIYTIDGDVSTIFSGSLMNYAQGEDFPTIAADSIQKIEINSQGKSFKMENDDQLDSGWKVTDENGETIEADITKVSEVKSTAAGLTYANYLEYNCQDFSEYGLDEPFAVIRIDYSETVIEDDKETVIDKSVILSVGDEDGSGNRYTHIEGSAEVHAISNDSLSNLLNKTAADMENLSVCNIDLSTIDKLQVNYKNETHEFTMKEDDSEITYYMDENEIDTLTFSSFYNNAIGITAKKKSEEKPEGKPELSLVFYRSDGSETEVEYYSYDTNYYIVHTNDKDFLVNKMDVRNLIDKYEALM